MRGASPILLAVTGTFLLPYWLIHHRAVLRPLPGLREESRRLMRANLKLQIRRWLGDMLFRLFGIGGYLALLFTGAAMMADGKMTFSDLVYCFQVRASILAGGLMLINCVSNIKINSIKISVAFHSKI